MPNFKESSDNVLLRMGQRAREAEVITHTAESLILPGDALTLTATGVVANVTTADDEVLLLALENRTPDLTALRDSRPALETPYQIGDTVYCLRPLRGDIVQVRGTAPVTVRDLLVTDGGTTAGQFTTDATANALQAKGRAVTASTAAGDLFQMEVL